MYKKLRILITLVALCISTAHAQNDGINPYVLSIRQGKTLTDKKGTYLETPVTLNNTSKDTLFYANWSCSWQELYKTDNPLLDVEVVDCDKNIMEVYALAPNDSTTVLLKLYSKFGKPVDAVTFRVGFELIKVPNLRYDVLKEERHSGNYLWSNTLTYTAGTGASKKPSWINPWGGENGFRFAGGYMQDLEMEASYLLTSYSENGPELRGIAPFNHYIGAGLEYVKDGPRNAAGAKLSYEVNYFLLSAQLGADYLITGGNRQARIMPKVGYSVLGVVTFYYGWNYNIIKDSNLKPYSNVITLQINLTDSLMQYFGLGKPSKKAGAKPL